MKSMTRQMMIAAALASAASLAPIDARAVEDGQGTNHVGVLSAAGLELGGETRTAWLAETRAAGGTIDFRAKSNEVYWAPAFPWTGQLGTVRLQTDGGDADAQVVRSKWNDPWGTYAVIQGIKATEAGVESAGWSSSWVSNGYRVGIVVTNFTTGTNLWWSVDCTRSGAP